VFRILANAPYDKAHLSAFEIVFQIGASLSDDSDGGISGNTICLRPSDGDGRGESGCKFLAVAEGPVLVVAVTT
jgi:hypothetical protein